MKHTMKTILCLLLILVMVGSLLPVSTLAANQDAASSSELTAKQEIVTEPIYSAAGPFSDGYAPVQDSTGKWGYVNESGELVVACKYDWANYCSEGVALAGMYEEVWDLYMEDYYDGTVLYLLDMTGGEKKLELSNYLCTEQLVGFNAYFQCVNGVVNAYWNPFTIAGEPITMQNPSELELTEYYHYMDGSTGAAYDFVCQTAPCANGLIPMSTNGYGQMPAYQCFLMDTQGNIVKSFEPTNELGIDGVSNVWVTENGLYIIQNAVEGAAWYERAFSYGLMDSTGKWIVEDGGFANFLFRSDGTYFGDGLFVIKDANGKWGAINASGEQVIECLYDEMGTFMNGYAPVVQDDKTFYLDTAGNEIFVTGPDGETADLVDAGQFYDGYASVCDSDGMRYLISDDCSGGTFVAVENSEGMKNLGPCFYELDGLYGVCVNSVEEKKAEDPAVEIGDCFIYVDGVKLELSKPILDIYEITYAEYVLLPDDQQNEWGTLKERVEKTTPVYVLEEGTQVSFPYPYTWGADISYIDYEGTGIYEEYASSGGYTPDYWWDGEVVLPVVWTIDGVTEDYIASWIIAELSMDSNGEYAGEWYSVGQLFYTVRAAENSEPEHSHSYTAEVTAPTCTSGGYTTYTCACGDSYVTDETPMIDHIWDEGVVLDETTEMGDVLVRYTCTACGKIRDRYRTPEGDFEYSLIAESEYNDSPEQANEGFGDGIVCGTLSDSDLIDFYRFTLDAESDIYITIGALEESLRFEVLDSSAEFVLIEGVPSKSTEDDYSGCEVRTCLPAGVYYLVFKDADEGSNEYMFWIYASNHSSHIYSSTVTDPTCTEGGYTTYTCACGDSYIEDETPALDHDYANGTCTRCGEADPNYVEPVENPFGDVKETDYFFEPVLWAVENAITSGTGAGQFSPNTTCTRAQVVTFLWRAMGKPEPESDDSPFTDVPVNAYYYDAVLWAVENNITSGTGNGRFSPDDPCTRGQVVTFLWRAMGKTDPESENNPFGDVKSNDYFYTPVLWAVEHGITSGTSATTFAPANPCTRAQVVTFLYRAMKDK